MPPDIRRETLARDESDARAHFLHHGHEGVREEREPDELRAVLRARLRVGGDAGRVVVGGPGREPGAERIPILLSAFERSLTDQHLLPPLEQRDAVFQKLRGRFKRFLDFLLELSVFHTFA